MDLEGSDTPISISLTEAGRYVDTGCHMTGEQWSKLKPNDLVIIYEDSGERLRARFYHRREIFQRHAHL
jgi:hypothetical protein